MNIKEKIQTVLRYSALGGVFILPLMPFIVTSSMFFPFITGKNFFFRIVVEIVVASWAALAVLDARYRPRFSWILGSLIAFVGIVTLADLVSPSLFKAFWSNFERMEGLVTILHLFGYVVALAGLLRTEQVRIWLLRTTVGASVIMGFYGLFQLFGFATINQGGVRLDGTLGNATYLAVYMLVHIFLTLWLLYTDRDKKLARYGYSAAVLLQTLILFYTATRGSILGLVGGVTLTALIIAVKGKVEHPRLWKGAVGMLAVVVLLVSGFFIMKATDMVPEGGPLARLASISLTERTVESRFLIWQTAWEGAKDRPLLGWGQEGFIYVFTQHYDPEMWKQEPWFDRAHNVFLDWLVAAGFPGLILYLLLFASALWYLWKGVHFALPERAILTGLFAAYFFHNLFVFDNIVSYWLFMTLIALVHIRYVYGMGTQEIEVSDSDITAKQYVILSVIGIVGVVFFYMVNIPGMQSARALLQALIPQEEGLQINLDSYVQAREYNTVGRQEAAEQLSGVAQRIVSFDVPNNLKNNFVVAAENALRDEIEKNELNPRPPFFLGGFLTRIGRPGDALPVLEHALELGPDRQITLFEIARAHQQIGNTEEALAAAEKAYLLAPEFENAVLLYAGLLFRTGASEQAETLLENIPLAQQARNSELIATFADTGRYDRLVALWEERVRQNPDDPETRLSLAASYVELGQREKAIAEIQYVIDQEPTFKEQGEFYITEIRAGRKP